MLSRFPRISVRYAFFCVHTQIQPLITPFAFQNILLSHRELSTGLEDSGNISSKIDQINSDLDRNSNLHEQPDIHSQQFGFPIQDLVLMIEQSQFSELQDKLISIHQLKSIDELDFTSIAPIWDDIIVSNKKNTLLFFWRFCYSTPSIFRSMPIQIIDKILIDLTKSPGSYNLELLSAIVENRVTLSNDSLSCLFAYLFKVKLMENAIRCYEIISSSPSFSPGPWISTLSAYVCNKTENIYLMHKLLKHQFEYLNLILTEKVTNTEMSREMESFSLNLCKHLAFSGELVRTSNKDSHFDAVFDQLEYWIDAFNLNKTGFSSQTIMMIIDVLYGYSKNKQPTSFLHKSRYFQLFKKIELPSNDLTAFSTLYKYLQLQFFFNSPEKLRDIADRIITREVALSPEAVIYLAKLLNKIGEMRRSERILLMHNIPTFSKGTQKVQAITKKHNLS